MSWIRCALVMIAGCGGGDPGPRCPLPALCDPKGTTCEALVPFSPESGPGYVVNPESAKFIRRDLMMVVQRAAAEVACRAAGWKNGNGGPLTLGDMSEEDGATPGTAAGEVRHPRGTHVNGRDIDITYFQVGTGDNGIRPICAHTAAGVDVEHCTATPTTLDVWRTALFIGAVFESPDVRVVGVDARAAPLLRPAIHQLCDEGWIERAACSRVRLGYEEEEVGRGWFRGHHNHLHVSLVAKHPRLTLAP